MSEPFKCDHPECKVILPKNYPLTVCDLHWHGHFVKTVRAHNEADPNLLALRHAEEDLTRLKRELDQANTCIQDRVRISDVCDEHWKRATAIIRHLWEDGHFPGIEGICQKLLEATKENAELKARLEKAQTGLSDYIQTFQSEYEPPLRDLKNILESISDNPPK